MAADPTVGVGGTFYVPFPILALASRGDDVFMTAGGGGSTNAKENPNWVQAHRYNEAVGKLSTIAALSTGKDLVVALSYSPVAKLWLASSKKGCKILQLSAEENTLTEIGFWETESEGKEPEQNFAFFSPDASMILTGGTDGIVKLFKAPEAGKEPALHRVCGAKTKEILDGAFSPDGKHVAACDGSGECRLWEIAKESPENGTPIVYTSKIAKGKALIKLVRFVPSATGFTLLLAANGIQRKLQCSVVGMFGSDGTLMSEVMVDNGPLKSIALAEDCASFVVGLMTGKKSMHKLPGMKGTKKTKELHSLPAQRVAFCGKSTAISVSGDRDIHMLNVSGSDSNFGFWVQVLLFLCVLAYMVYRIGMTGAMVGQGRSDL